MQRDQRVQDNWALLYAAECAEAVGQPLCVVFNMVTTFGAGAMRQFDFLLRGLAEVEAELRTLGIPFYVVRGDCVETIPAFVSEHTIGHVVTDFNPLRFTAAWRTDVAKRLMVRLTQVDAHNVVPAWIASPKLEFAAYTLRPKIHRLLTEFLTPIPRLTAPRVETILPSPVDWRELSGWLVTDRTVAPVTWLEPGTKAAKRRLVTFCNEGLYDYATKRNDPVLNHVSHLSPYLHFGQIGAQRIALEVSKSDADRESRDAYLEELIVRRELADNFCLYNPDYDQVAGAHAWAQTTITEHSTDVREYVYTLVQFEAGETHDELWNAAQLQMVSTGKMHGFMRMYWAKKILEWTPDAQTAIDTALYLNDKYELDGRDPNGVAGVMWSICGVHDRAWNPRPVFGKIRYMNYNGCKRKFDVMAYIAEYGQKPGSLFL
jgi:deoxyribodipyrimidine photo-lyase